jgi:hypothetical protein
MVLIQSASLKRYILYHQKVFDMLSPFLFLKVLHNAKINIAIVKWVRESIIEHSLYLGILEYQLSVYAFFVGIDDATKLNQFQRIVLESEISKFWEVVERRKKRLEHGDF